MVLIQRTVKNLLSLPISIRIPGYDLDNLVTLQPSVNTDLLDLLSPDELESIRVELDGLVSRGSLQSIETITLADLHIPVNPVEVSRLIDWVISTDVLIQFAPVNGDSVQNVYSASLLSHPFQLAIWVTNGTGVLDVFNSTETVTVNAIGGTVNGGPSVIVTVQNGVAVLNVDRLIAGDTTLTLSDNTRLGISDTAVIHWA